MATFKIDDFKSKLVNGGARPNLFRCTINDAILMSRHQKVRIWVMEPQSSRRAERFKAWNLRCSVYGYSGG